MQLHISFARAVHKDLIGAALVAARDAPGETRRAAHVRLPDSHRIRYSGVKSALIISAGAPLNHSA
jgi:hypothetical protein